MPKSTADRIFWVYLTVLGLVCSGLVWYASATYGPGVGTDGALQVSTADHLLVGQGFVDYAGEPYLRWPPLYPIVLAGLSLVSGLSTFSIAWYLNIALFAVIVWLAGAILRACFAEEPFWAYAGSLVLATSHSNLVVCATIGTDPLFMALVLAWLLLASRYYATRSRGAFVGMALLACLASLQRLPGITLVATGMILILLTHRGRWWVGVGKALPFAMLTLLPLVLWTLLHSYLQYHSFFGVSFLQATYPRVNFIDSLRKILYWFVPNRLISYVEVALLAAAPVVFLLAITRRISLRQFGSRLLRPPVFSSLVFAAFYYAFLIFTINSIDTTYYYYDRYYIVIMAPILVLIFAVVQDLLLARFVRHASLARLVVAVLFAGWLAFPLHNFIKHVNLSRQEGVPYYNKYNTRAMRELPVVEVLRRVGSEGEPYIYSNYPAAAWFFLRRDVMASPRGSIIGDVDMDQLEQRFSGWPGEKPGYLVWFLPNEYDHVLDLHRLENLAELTPIYKGEDGRVYQVQARGK